MKVNTDRVPYSNDMDDTSDLEKYLDRSNELLKYCPQNRLKAFDDWITTNDIRNYDGIDRWLIGRKVVETHELFNLFDESNQLTVTIK